MKVTIIGAGSVVFARKVIRDILSFDALRGCTISLMDIDEKRLELIGSHTRRLVEQERLPAKVEQTTDRRKALDGADHIVVMIQVGGLPAFKLDIEIPLRYGVEQCVGDTLGPGGVFRGLRTIPLMLSIARDCEELCPEAYIFNYSNPMAMNCWALNEASRIKTVGLCHGVQGTARHLADYIGVPADEIDYWTAGINHMAWFLRLEHKGEDAYPMVRERLLKQGPPDGDRIRFEVFRQVGYFMTESSGHFSEYIPYFRKRKDLMEKYVREGFGGETGAYYKTCSARLDPHMEQLSREARGEERIPFGERSVEYVSNIINSLATGDEYRFNGNVRNARLITNLPEGCCVEVPCYVDRTGIHPVHVGELPPVCAALCRTNVSVQELAVKAALEKDKESAFHAVLLDPLSSAVLEPAEVRRMVDELFEAEKEWLW